MSMAEIGEVKEVLNGNDRPEDGSDYERLGVEAVVS